MGQLDYLKAKLSPMELNQISETIPLDHLREAMIIIYTRSASRDLRHFKSNSIEVDTVLNNALRIVNKVTWLVGNPTTSYLTNKVYLRELTRTDLATTKTSHYVELHAFIPT